jgi:serine/threonine protein kinase
MKGLAEEHIGKTLNHFKVLARLGKGGMGEVYIAEDGKLKRRVALKVLPELVASDPARLERFQREAEACNNDELWNEAGAGIPISFESAFLSNRMVLLDLRRSDCAYGSRIASPEIEKSAERIQSGAFGENAHRS